MTRRFELLSSLETPVLLLNGKICFMRTVKNIPDIFTEEEWADIKAKHYIHELGYMSNLSPDYEGVIKDGLLKRRETADEYGKRVIDAIIRLSDRYKEEAKKHGKIDIVKTLERIPRYGATNFREALQFFRIIHFSLWLEGNYHNTVGRFDKYMYSYLQADMENMADAIAFSDDGKGIQSEEMMLMAMEKAKALGKIIVAHCEDNSLLYSGYIHDGEYAKLNGHRGICSESEYGPIARDIELAKKSGCAYHVCHISTKESVDLIRKAKKDGVNITCETAPHYLLLDDMDLKEDGRFKMNPPLRSRADKLSLIEGITDGTIDMIATDHAPHSAEEKSKGLEKSAFGIVGIETAFPLMYTSFVKTGILTMEKLIELMSKNPMKRFNIPLGNSFSVWNLEKEYKINPGQFVSMGKATPFEGMNVFGECELTVCDNKIAFRK